jgi:ATP diphosphatase
MLAMAEMTVRSDNPIDRLLAIMARLRDPQRGCPWDVEQTFDTIAPYTIEEAYEVADAIQRRDWDDLQGELGDLLLQVVYHARMAEEEGRFDFADVARGIGDKMVRRHPHVFGPADDSRTAEEQTHAWEAQKAAERDAAGTGATLDGVALGLPALTRALKLQKRLARVGFDWPEESGVLEKIAEEAREIGEARAGGGDVEGEVGDLLFAIVNYARHLGVDPEAALRRSNAKVERRFAAVEARLAERGMTPQQAELGDMDALWDAAKAVETSD